jgi:hypothetical protein
MRKRFLRKCVIGLILLLMLAALTLLSSTSITQAQPPGDTVQIIVKFKASDDITAFAAAVQGSDNITPIAAAIQASGGRGLRDLPQLRTRVISVPANAAENVLAAFARDPSVERATKAIKFHQAGTPDDPGYTQQWALPRIAWDQVYGTTPITGSATIAVLDTGVDAGHPDLAGRMGSGQSFVNGNANSDPNGHGTALAGIAAANVNNAMGVAGVAYAGVTVSSVQVLQPDGTGWDSDVIAGVVWAADNGAKVILMGFSSADYSSALADALQYAWSKGVVLVAATGNDSSSAPSYPAGMENVLGVASTDQDDNVAAYSNTGSACVAAPGLDIYTTMAGGNYGSISGTSAAAAETAGLAALLVASGQSNDYIYNQVRGAVDPITDQSFGRINVATAMGEAVTPPPSPPPAPPPPPGPTPPVYAPAAIKTFTGPGNFSEAARWGGTLPAAGDTLRINGTCTFDNAAANLAYGPLNVGRATVGTLNWPVGGTNTLNVTTVRSSTAGSAINMTNGGTLQIRTSWTTTNQTFTPGAGTINWNVTNAASTLPAAITTYNNLTITATGRIASLGVATTVSGNLFISAGTLSVSGSNYGLTVKGNWTNNGTFTAGSGTVTLSGTSAQAIGGTATTAFSNLTISNTAAAVSANANFNVSGILTVSANAILTPAAAVQINSSAPAGTITGSGTVQVTRTAATADYSNQYKFTTNTLTNLTIEYNGTAAQIVSALTYGNLKINNSSGVTLAGTVTVGGTLTFTKGNITTGSSYTVAIASGGSVSRTSGHVVGNLRMYFGTEDLPANTFHVGTATAYTPVTVDIDGTGGTAGNLTATTAGTAHPNIGTSGLNTAKDVDRYWTVTPDSTFALGGRSYKLKVEFLSTDVPGGADYNKFELRKYSLGSWSIPTGGVYTRDTISTQYSNFTSFGDFAVGEPIEFINFTVTDNSGSDGINFGNPDPGEINQPAVGQTLLLGAVTLTVYPDTNVAVKVQLKGGDFAGPGTPIDITNVKYNDSDNPSGASTMQDYYDVLPWYTVPAYTKNERQCYYWISIPGIQLPGVYNSTFSYQAIKTP